MANQNMSVRGVRPTPLAIQILRGSEPRNMNPDEPDMGDEDLTSAPDFFTDSQKAIWDYAVRCCPPTLLRLADRDTMTVWACAVDSYVTLTKDINSNGYWFEYAKEIYERVL